MRRTSRLYMCAGLCLILLKFIKCQSNCVSCKLILQWVGYWLCERGSSSHDVGIRMEFVAVGFLYGILNTIFIICGESNFQKIQIMFNVNKCEFESYWHCCILQNPEPSEIGSQCNDHTIWYEWQKDFRGK